MLPARTWIVPATCALTLSIFAAPAADADARAASFRNCTALNKVYPHGVGKRGAIDKTTGVRVTNFLRNNAIYTANKARDRDKDGIACEKR